MNIPLQAAQFARAAHAGQIRKYTRNPYHDHLAEVAGYTAAALPGDQIAIATAWLHDTIEDCPDVTFDLLTRRFGSVISHGVMLLSDIKDVGNRAERKRATRLRLNAAPAWVQTIKCADILSNSSSIRKHDLRFATTYCAENQLLLDMLPLADPILREMALESLTA